MKTVKEINEIRGIWDACHTCRAIGKICDALIGITEHLEAQRQGPGATLVKRDGTVYRMDRCGTEEEHAEFLRSGAVPSDALPVQSDDAARRAAMIEALEWAKMNPLLFQLENAITHLENGGDL